MKTRSKLLTFVLLSATSVWAQADPPGRVGRLAYVQGQVSFEPAGVEEWAPAELNRPLSTGDRLWADSDGRAVIQMGAAAIHLNSQTSFSFVNLSDTTAQIRLTEGDVNVRLRHLYRDETFEIDTPNVAVSLLHAGEYRVQVRPDGNDTVVIVRDGEAELTGGGQSLAVHKHQLVQIAGGDPPAVNRGHAPDKDGFDRFCETRLHREDRSEAARYVSRDMVGYEDLDDQGDWRDAPGYGHAWFPRGVAVGWAPYHDGHWAWSDPFGWTWVDEAPWGFAPFHYGRWASVGGAWGWVPGPMGAEPVYAPALVGFVGAGDGDGVGWFPLGPGEPFVPGYHASEGYWNKVNRSNTVINKTVNITKIYNDNSVRNSNNTNNSNNTDNSINHSSVGNTKYVNQGVPGAVTAVPHSAFAGGQAVSQARLALPPQQAAKAQVLSAPAVAPTRQAVVASPGAAPVARPAAASVNRAVMAKQAPPPPPVPFAQQQQALATNPGRPLAPAALQNLRQNPLAQHSPAPPPALNRTPTPSPAAASAPGRPLQPSQPAVAPRVNNWDRPPQPSSVQPNVAPRVNNPDRPPQPSSVQPSVAPRVNNPDRPYAPPSAQPNVAPRVNNSDRPYAAPSAQPNVAPRVNGPNRPYQSPTIQPTARVSDSDHAYQPPTVQPTARVTGSDRPYQPPTVQPTARASGSSQPYRPPVVQPTAAAHVNSPARSYQPPSVQPNVQPRVNNAPRSYQAPKVQPAVAPRVNNPAPRSQPAAVQPPRVAARVNNPAPAAHAPPPKKDEKTRR